MNKMWAEKQPWTIIKDYYNNTKENVKFCHQFSSSKCWKQDQALEMFTELLVAESLYCKICNSLIVELDIRFESVICWSSV